MRLEVIDSAFASYRQIAREAASTAGILAPLAPLVMSAFPGCDKDPVTALKSVRVPLIFVHGTFASGPEGGHRWWQRGSAFDGHLHHLIGAENGDVAVERFVWDGNNSVASRRAAISR